MLMNIILIIVSIALIFVIVLQSKGTGLSGVLSGSTNYHAKRGLEKSMFYTTIILSVIFIAISLANTL